MKSQWPSESFVFPSLVLRLREPSMASPVYMADPPPGRQRHGGDTLQPNMAACAITTAIIAVAVVGLRLYTRFFLTAARFQMDDGTLSAGMAVC